MQALAGLPNLTTLNLHSFNLLGIDCIQVSDHGLQALGDLTALTSDVYFYCGNKNF
jgi:hypothetical protein